MPRLPASQVNTANDMKSWFETQAVDSSLSLLSTEGCCPPRTTFDVTASRRARGKVCCRPSVESFHKFNKPFCMLLNFNISTSI